MAAEPARLDVDLSRAGVFRGPLNQTCAMAHAEVFELVVASPASDAEVGEDALAGLQARLTITDSNGQEAASEVFSAESAIRGPRSGRITLFRMNPFREGRYELALHVDGGAPALAGHPQYLVAHYELCGLERMPAGLAQLIGIVAGGIGVLLVTLAISFMVLPPARS